MKSQEFIKSKIEDIIQLHPHLRVKYEFDSFDHSHYIEISPSKYQYNEDICEMEDNIELEFISKFPYEGLCFVNSSSSIQIKNASYVRTGSLFNIEELQNINYIENINQINLALC